MSKQCAKCSKTVYPTEELKCLDKVWHKFCFKCTTCGMTLNLKNFQGFDRMPYCRAHTPKAKHTNVTDTPEINRVKEATKNQSLAAYHENFEKNFKGRATQIADDPETLRLLKNQNTFSNVRYQEEYIKSKAGKMPIEGEDQNYSQGDHHQHQQYADTQRMPPPGAVPVHAVSAVPNRINAEDNFNSPYSSRNQGSSVVYSSQGKDHPEEKSNAPAKPKRMSEHLEGLEGTSIKQKKEMLRSRSVEQNQSNRKVGSINDYDPLNEQYGSIAQGHQPYSSYGGQQWQETVPVSRVQAPDTESPDEYEQPPTNGSGPRERPKSKLPPGAVPAAGLVSLSQIQNVAITAIEEDFLPPQLRAQRLEAEKQKETYRGQESPDEYEQPPQHQGRSLNSDRQRDIDREKDSGSQDEYELPPQLRTQNLNSERDREMDREEEQPPAPVSQPPPPAPPSSSSAVYKAMYDYDAADDDEVSFRDGDIIINTEPIDDGWMYGTVQRSGQTGMLPSNYVERIQ